MKKILTLLFLFSYLIFPLKAQNWTAFDSTMTNNFVTSFIEFQNELYVTGLFTEIGDVPTNFIAKWNGDSWEPVGEGLDDWGHGFTIDNNLLFVAQYQRSQGTNRIKYWDGRNWDYVSGDFTIDGFNFYNIIYDIVSYNNQLVCIGEFRQVDGVEVNGVAIQNGDVWEPAGTGFSDPFPIPGSNGLLFPHDAIVFENELIVGGNFRKANDSIQVNGIARWDGSTWKPMGKGFDAVVYGLGIYNGELYAGGEFTSSNDTPLGGIAKWDGEDWIDVGTETNGWVHTFKEIDGNLYIGGGFTNYTNELDSDVACGNILMFDGNDWQNLNGGANSYVEAIIKFQDKILVGGDFSLVQDTIAASRLALWDDGIEEPIDTTFVNLLEVSSSNNIVLSPNPSLNDIHLSFELIENSLISLEIFDMLGQQRQTIYDGNLQNGNHHFTIDLKKLSSGNYFIQIKKRDNYNILPFTKS